MARLQGEALERQRDRLAAVRFTAHLDGYRQFHDGETIKQRTVEMLRKWGPDERALIGRQQITAWFAAVQVGNRLGKYASWDAITGWRKRLDCPILRGKGPKAPPWTTAILLRAWLLSLFSTDNTGGPRVWRRHWAACVSGTEGGPQGGSSCARRSRGTHEGGSRLAS